MKNRRLVSFATRPALLIFAVLLTSCASSGVSPVQLSAQEQNLLTALNRYRVQQGKAALQPSASLTALAREDAARRANTGSGDADIRQRTGYERMLTLSGRARGGEQFGEKLVGFWSGTPQQVEWLQGSYANVGVGTSDAGGGLENGVLLLGGFGM